MARLQGTNENVIFVEPNEVENYEDRIVNSDGSTSFLSCEMPPKMEDFCIAVDLKVEIMNRGNGHTTSNPTILCSWNSSDGTCSFFKGTTFSFHGEKSANYMTTSAYDFATYSDVLEGDANGGTTNECFGINSIDIQYNNYSVPEVTIEFTDIRGISLFAPEELRHSSVDEDGVSGYYDNTKDIAGSFFKSFFTFPYPRFTLMVKGFYGEPVTYELACTDFRARFNSDSGNFGATAKFVGYSYSLLGDVTMNALTVAPYNEYFGKNYWQTCNFKFSDDTSMPTLMEVIKRIAELHKTLEENRQTSAESMDDAKINADAQAITTAIEQYKNYCNKVKEIAIKYFGKDNVYFNSSKCILAFYEETNDFTSLKYYNYGNDEQGAFNLFKTYMQGLEANRLIDRGRFVCTSSPTDEVIRKGVMRVMVSNNFNDSNSGRTLFNSCFDATLLKDKDNIHFYYADCNEFYTYIEKEQKKLINKQQESAEAIAKNEKKVIVDTLGFNPTVENVTELVMAHLETLVYSVYKCHEEVESNPRSASDLGLSTTDLNTSKFSNGVPVFPGVMQSKTENSYQKLEEGWIGDLDGGKDTPEYNLINGMLNAVKDTEGVLQQAVNAMNEDEVNNIISYSMPIPLCLCDIVTNASPFGDEVKSDMKIDSLAGHLALRALNLFGMNTCYSEDNNYEVLGYADAINFYSTYGDLSLNILHQQIQNGQVSADDIIETLLDKESGIQKPWMSENSTTTEAFFARSEIGNTNFLWYNQYRTKNNTAFLPIENITWNTINSSVLRKVPTENQMANYLTNNIVVNPSGNKYMMTKFLVIDKDYKKYDATSLMMYEEKPFSYVGNLNLTFDIEKYKKCFGDENVIFSQCLNVDLTQSIEHGYMLPLDKKIAEKELSFDGYNSKSNGAFDEDFSWIKLSKNATVIERPKGSFSTIQNIDDVSAYTIPRFKGLYDGRFVADCSLFGQKGYYNVNSTERAAMFISSFAFSDTSFRNDLDGIKVNAIAEMMGNMKTPSMIVPYYSILAIGANLWRMKQQAAKGKTTPIGYINRFNEASSLLRRLREDYQQGFINEFLRWKETEFTKIQAAFELKTQANGVDILYNLLKENAQGKRDKIINYIYDTLGNNFVNQYVGLKAVEVGDSQALILYNRETSSMVRQLTQSLVQPCIVMKLITNREYAASATLRDSKRNSNLYIRENDFRAYTTAFLKKLREIYVADVNDTSRVNYQGGEAETSEHIKRSLYKYIKVLWDKWLSGSQKDVWSMEKFYKGKFHYIDSFYNKVNGTVLDINLLMQDLVTSQRTDGYSLLSFLSTSFARNRFGFYCVQNFYDMGKSDNVANFEKMFKPIPYNEIDWSSLNYTPHFIFMYTHEFSSKLDIDGSEYKSDSFDLRSNTDLPLHISTKTSQSGYKIPAFGVVYGKQYQSYFKDIDVSMDSPLVTETALKAQYMICGAYESSDASKKIISLGQDLYSIYSNNSYACTVKMMGCAWIQPLMYFQLTNVPMFRGAYLIQKVSHHLEPGKMETTFVGTRMANKNTPMVESANVVTSNDLTNVVSQREAEEGKRASIDNNCQYAFYNPLRTADGGMSEEELNMTCAAYETKKGHKFFSGVDLSWTINRLLAAVLANELNESHGKLQKQLTMTVVFNRWKDKKEDLTQVFFNKSQHEITAATPSDTDMQIARDIFMNTPMVIVGTKTNVAKSLNIYDKKALTNHKTESVVISEDMVRSMYYYCSYLGYKNPGQKGVEPLSYWHEGPYVCQHDSPKIATTNYSSHIYTGNYTKGGSIRYYWEATAKSTTNKDALKKKYLDDFFDSLKKTLDTAENIKYRNLIRLSSALESQGELMLSVEADNVSETMNNVYDAIVQTYYDYCESIIWCVKNDSTESPYRIIVKPTTDYSATKKLYVSNISKPHVPLNDYDNLPKAFYTTLGKRFGVLDGDKNKLKEFQVNCPNFNQFISANDDNWGSLMDSKLTEKGGNVKDCKELIPITNINYSTSKGYSWLCYIKSERVTIGDNIKPLKTYNAQKALEVCKTTNNGGGQCLKAVRTGMEAGAGDISFPNRPKAACEMALYLPKLGFTCIWEGTTQELQNLIDKKGIGLNDGDIQVNASCEKGKYGHIQMYDSRESKHWQYGKGHSQLSTKTYSDGNMPTKVFRWMT